MGRPDPRPALLWLALAVALGCSRELATGVESGARRTPVAIAGRIFQLEAATDRATRTRGLSGRRQLAADGGMLFVYPRPNRFAMVMRDCWVPIGVAFLDRSGRVLAVHEMLVEPPRREGESPRAYEGRLRRYGSPAPAQFAVELAGGVLARLGVKPGDRVVVQEAEALIAAAEP